MISKDIDCVANLIVDSDATDKIVNVHSESEPPKSKKELRKTDKSVFDSSITQFDFRTDTTKKFLKAVVDVHKACQTALAADGKVAFRHLKLYDNNKVFQLSTFAISV